ncbi:MAG: dephospho-CoA kinase [Parachlamydiaceae bacterium]|nr:dephospho-CoA kinase [Parachlamydiaceae bacterium]
MLRLRKIAVTGGLACGKSSVCRFLKELGAYVVSADDIVHQLLSPNTTLGRQVIQLLGAEIVVNGQIDRLQIAQKVFNHTHTLQTLESLLHPAVYAEIERHYQEALTIRLMPPLFVAEIPLLFETKKESDFDAVIVVMAPDALCKQRFQETKKGNGDEYTRRAQQQMSVEEKAERATYIIHNNGTLAELQQKVQEIFKQLR